MNECMKRAQIESITVKDICQEANVSRQTFYRCFEDKYDLINWYFDRILNESFRQMGQGKTVRDSLIKKFNYIKEEYLFFRVSFATDTQNNLRDHDFEMIFDFYQNYLRQNGVEVTDSIKDILEMYCYASVYMTVKWVLNGVKESPEKLAETMIQAMPEELSKVFKKLNILK